MARGSRPPTMVPRPSLDQTPWVLPQAVPSPAPSHDTTAKAIATDKMSAEGFVL